MAGMILLSPCSGGDTAVPVTRCLGLLSRLGQQRLWLQRPAQVATRSCTDTAPTVASPREREAFESLTGPYYKAQNVVRGWKTSEKSLLLFLGEDFFSTLTANPRMGRVTTRGGL